MSSRIVTLVSVTLYFVLIISFTIIGFASLIVGAVGLANFIPTYKAFKTYRNNTCLIVDIDYDWCPDTGYCVMWSVEYYISNAAYTQLLFSTIVNKFESTAKAMQKIDTYDIITSQICYYDTTKLVNVQWEQPVSPTPYFFMMIIGLSLNVAYIISIALCSFFQSKQVPE
ncbi:unnamed protein product [Rotaria socialis]|uniref:Uncharacterized protein n=1 Tax=Rotaria socialis TaxID=392032 RepID=A0A821SNR9_9BILA|nr:unnamed protein product [Rotaria socialis]CAF3499896.1 unnamed protein product [Rotaria socialis]CAF4441573.1 unnamed protein product [Rotaria socialis]CAF4862852.1 unnamed protein product [Rotaria socialis]